MFYALCDLKKERSIQEKERNRRKKRKGEKEEGKRKGDKKKERKETFINESTFLFRKRLRENRFHEWKGEENLHLLFPPCVTFRGGKKGFKGSID